MLTPFAAVLFLSACVSAHFRIPVPGERNATNWDTQTTGPCGGANQVVQPRFLFHPNGSPLGLDLHHPLSVGQVRYCAGNNCTTQADFSVVLIDSYEHNGSGNFCIPALTVPGAVGSNGTIQVVYVGTGKAQGQYVDMFNCLDVSVSESGPKFSDQCSNSSSVDITPMKLDSSFVGNATHLTVIDNFFASTLSASAVAAAAASTHTLGTFTNMDDMCTMPGMENMPGMNCPTGVTTAASATKAASASSSVTRSSTTSGSGAGHLAVGGMAAVMLAFL